MTDLLAYIGIFLAVLGESTIVVGAFVPGISVVITSIFLASTGSLNVVLIFIAAWLGMFIGDNLGYALGRYGVGRIPIAERWFNKAKPQVEDFMTNHPRLVVFYQFVGFARAPLPIFLGSIKHPFRHWLILVLQSTTIFLGLLVPTCFFVAGLFDDSIALKVAIIAQMVVGGVFALVIIRSLGQRSTK